MSPAGSQVAAGEHGFTLLELMVVMALMALLATMAFPMLKGQLDRTELARESRDIASVFAGSRRYARLSGETVLATMDLKARTLTGPKGLSASWSDTSVLNIEAAAGLIADDKVDWVFFHDGTATGGDVAITRTDLDPIVVKVDWLSGVTVHDG